MARSFDYKLVVIGSGAAGTATAMAAAQALKSTRTVTEGAETTGAKVALVEAGAWGGTTLNTRDVAYGAMLEFSHLYARVREATQMGISSEHLRYNLPTATAWRQRAVRKVGGGSKKAYEDAGIDCYKGTARFLNPYEIAVGKKQIAAPRFVIATGASIDKNSLAGTDKVPVLTPEEAIALTRKPKAVLVVGAGSTGCETAQYFAELGVQVILCEQLERILPCEDAEVSTLMAKYLTKKLGVKILTGACVVGVEKDQTSKRVIFVANGREKAVRMDTIVLANEAQPNVAALGLENARVNYSQSGIKVDRGLQTSSKHIWAAGDVIGGESSAEKAAYEGALAAANAVKHARQLINYSGLMRVTDTYPQVAKVGMNELDCMAQKIRGTKKALVPLVGRGAAATKGFGAGFVKLLADKQGKLLGATVVAPTASLVAQEVALALRHDLTALELGATPHPAYGWGEALQAAAKKLAK